MSNDGDGLPPNVSTNAQSPFDDVNADIILHTSDHVDFRVFRLILTLSSPFFQGMFTIPQPPDAHINSTIDTNPPAQHDGVSDGAPLTPPSITVSEDSATLDTLLRFLYPNTRPPPFNDPLHALNVALAASKYAMSAALDSIADSIKGQYIVLHPLHAYLIACRMGWESIARATAERCLDPALMPDKSSDCDALLSMPGAGVAYYRLDKYRDACRTALKDQLYNSCLSENNPRLDCKEVDCNGGISKYCLDRWAELYLADIKKAVLENPTRYSLDYIYPDIGTDCKQCQISKAHDMVTARVDIIFMIDRVLSEVELEFDP